MALRVKRGDVPENAVILTRTEAVSYQWKQITEWKPQSDVWPYTYGVGLLGGLASATAMYINFKFRKALKLKVGAFASLTATSVCPGIMATILQIRYVVEETFLPIEHCPLCIEMKSVAIQNAVAIAYTALLVPITNFTLAIRCQTHRIPHYKNWRELLLFCKYLYKPILPSIGLLCVANSVAASFILHKQINSLSYIHEVMSLEEPHPNAQMLNDFF